MPNPPTQPTGCLGTLVRLGELIATGAILIAFGGVGALSSAASGLMGGTPDIGATLLAMLLNAFAGFLIGSLSGLLTTRQLNRNDADARQRGQRASEWNEPFSFVALILTGALCGGIGSVLTSQLFAGTITFGGGMLYGGGVALVSAAVLWSQLQGSA